MADEVRALASRHPSLALAFTAQERYSLPAAAGYPVWILELSELLVLPLTSL